MVHLLPHWRVKEKRVRGEREGSSLPTTERLQSGPCSYYVTTCLRGREEKGALQLCEGEGANTFPWRKPGEGRKKDIFQYILFQNERTSVAQRRHKKRKKKGGDDLAPKKKPKQKDVKKEKKKIMFPFSSTENGKFYSFSRG